MSFFLGTSEAVGARSRWRGSPRRESSKRTSASFLCILRLKKFFRKQSSARQCMMGMMGGSARQKFFRKQSSARQRMMGKNDGAVRGGRT